MAPKREAAPVPGRSIIGQSGPGPHHGRTADQQTQMPSVAFTNGARS
ncbi:MAG TPA: hypothetical protein VNO31_38945 [Umezawaea sp.]|nr:hypothetical protein [Umezawaea sp.]